MAFSDWKIGLDDTAAELASAGVQAANLKSSAEALAGTLAAISSSKTPLIQAIQAAAVAAPSNPALQAMSAEATELVAEYAAKYAIAQAVLAAFGS